MKVIAFNGSPKMDKGNTALVLERFLEGIKDAGGEVELYHTKKLNIKPCEGDYNCWFKTPGQCQINDDMKKLLPRIFGSDLLIFATPVYGDGVTGTMKNLLDRMVLMFLDPFIELREGRTRHIPAIANDRAKVVLVATCGLWEMENFDPVLAQVNGFCKNGGRQFVGALLRPHAELMVPIKDIGMNIDDIFNAIKKAGKQLINDGVIAKETLEVVGRKIIPRDIYIKWTNQKFEQLLKEARKQ